MARKREPDQAAEVIGAAAGGAVGGVVGALVAGPIGAALSAWIGHQVTDEASRKGY